MQKKNTLFFCIFERKYLRGAASRVRISEQKNKIKRVIFCLFEREWAYIVRKFMGVAWELVGSCLGVAWDLRALRKSARYRVGYIPNTSRMHPECFFALQIIFFG